MCSVWIWEQTAIISLYSINWLVSGLCIIQINLSVWKSIWTLWLTKWHWDRLSPVTTIPPMVRIYPHLNASLNHKDKRAMPGGLPKRNAVSQTDEYWTAEYFRLMFKEFFWSSATTWPCGLRGPPSRAWQQCNRLLRLGRAWGAVTLSRWCEWWYRRM